MGTWGTEIFSNDTSRDIRLHYLELVGDGLTGVAATDLILDEWQDSLTEFQPAPDIWLGLAATQWDSGRLEDRVKARALAIINSGDDLVRWDHDPNLVKERMAVLGRLKKTLETPQPAKKRIPKRFRNYSEWKKGDIISYQLNSGRYILFRVIGHHSDRGGTSPVFELLDWIGDKPPTKWAIRRTGIREGGRPLRSITQFIIGRFREAELPVGRVKLVLRRTKTKQKLGSYTAFLWSNLDTTLEEYFDLT